MIKYLKKENLQWNLSMEYTTYLRCIAILFVIIQHIGSKIEISVFTPLGGIGVAIFLLISGYGLNESFKKKKLSCFWKNKFMRVFLPCWIVEIISAIIYFNQFDINEFINHLLCIDRNWFIRYLTYWYVIFYITSLNHFIKYRTYLMSMFSIIILLFFPNIEGEQAFSFLLGVILSQYKNSINEWIHSNKNKIIFVLLFIGISALAIKQTPIIREYENNSSTFIFNFIQCLIKLPLALFVIIATNYFIYYIKSPILYYGGIISFELYLIHCKFLFLINRDTDLTNYITFIFLTIVLSITLHKITNYLTKK